MLLGGYYIGRPVAASFCSTARVFKSFLLTGSRSFKCFKLVRSQIAVWLTTLHTDRFGGAGCCATDTVCGLNCVAARASAGVRAVAGGYPLAPPVPCVTENAVFHAAFFTDFACGAGERSGAAGMCGRFPIWLIADLADGAFCARSFAAGMCGQFPIWLFADLADGAFCARSRAARVRSSPTRIHFARITPINKLMIV